MKKINLRSLCYIISTILFIIVQYFIAKHGYPHKKSLLFSVLALPIPFLFMNLGRFFAPICMTLLCAIIFFNLFLVVNYSLITNGMLLVISGASKNEVISVVHDINPAFIVFLLLFLGSVFIISRKYAQLNLKNIAIFSILLLPACGFVYTKYDKKKDSLEKDLNDKFIPTDDWHEYALRYLMPGYIGNTYYMTAIYMKKNTSFSKTNPHSRIDNLITKKNMPNIQNIILVVGESDFAGRHNAYGYTKYITTPMQNVLQQQNKICFIPKAHSAANMTRNAVPLILSFATPEHPRNLTDEKNIIELAKDNQYYTWWIGSQDYTDFSDRTFSYIVGYSDKIITSQSHKYQYNISYNDNSLLPAIETEFRSKRPFKFYVIHILGSHTSYSDKYDPVDAQELPTASAYDRSIHHTDRILNKIINMADRELKNYVLLYTPDHGEVVSMGETTGAGHGLHFGGYDQYRIPMFVAGENHEKYCKQLEDMRHDDGYFSETSDKIFLSSLLGYSIDRNQLEKDKQQDKILHSNGHVYEYRNLPR